MRLRSGGGVRKAALAVVGTALAGSLVAATALSATGAEGKAGYLIYPQDGGGTVTTYYDNMSDLISAAKSKGTAEITIGLNSDWDTSSYGYIEVPNHAKWTIDMNGHMINRGKARADYYGDSKGEVFHVLSGVTLNINGGDTSLRHVGYIATDSNGGELWLSGSGSKTQIINGGLITGGACDDENGAGAISIFGNDNTVTLTGVTVAGNYADDYGVWYDGDAGAIAVRDGVNNTVTLSDTDVMYNHAEASGGAIGVFTKNNTINVKDGSNISHNSSVASSWSAGRAKPGAGAIYMGTSSTGSVINIDASSVDNNRAKGWGGAIVLNAPTQLNVSGRSTLNNNYSANDGGAVYTYTDGSTVSIDDSSVAGNEAATDGGAFFLNDKTTFTLDHGAQVTENKAADGDGGAAYVDDSDTVIVVKGVSSVDDRVTSVSKNTAADYGGAFYFDGSSDALTVSGNATVSYNSSNLAGGAVYHNGTGGAIALESGTSMNGNESSGGTGGAIFTYYDDTKISVNGATMNDNKAKAGGAIYAEDRADITFSEATVTGNKATNGRGGVIYVNDIFTESIVFYQTKVTGNEASTSGGVVYSTYKASVLSSESTFTGNKALGGAGGAFYLRQSSSFENTSMSSNTATSEGGAIYLVGSVDLALSKGTTIESNSADERGGAIYAASASCKVTLDKSSAKGNTAKSDGGFAYFNESGSLVLKDGSTVSANTANCGGLLYAAAGGAVSLAEQSLVDSNSADADGGAVYAKSGSLGVSLDDSEISSNSAAKNGGAVYAEDASLDIKLTNASSMKKNTAVARGGAFYVSDGPLTIKSDDRTGTLTQNKAGDNGGLIFLNNTNGTSLLSGVEITENEGTDGSAVFFTGSLNIVDTTVEENVSDLQYGGAFTCASAEGTDYTVTLAGTVNIKNNDNASGAGGNFVLKGDQKLDLSPNADLLDAASRVYVTVFGYIGQVNRQLSATELFAKDAAGVLKSDNPSYSIGYISGDDPQLYLRPYPEGVARVQGTDSAYATLADAVRYAPAGSVIDLVDNVEEGTAVAGKKLTISLNGFTISSADGSALTFGDGADVTVKDGIVSAESDAIAVSGGSLTVSDVTASSTGGSALSVSGGSVNVAGSGCSFTGTPAVKVTAGTLVVSDGSFSDTSFVPYLAAGKFVFKPLGKNYAVVSDRTSALASATTVVTDKKAGTQVYFENYVEAAAYAATLEQPDISRVTSIAAAKVTLKKTSLVYTGKAYQPAVKRVVLGGKVLKAGTDYTVSAAPGKKVGVYKVTIIGDGPYAGSAAATYTIVPAKVAKVKAKAKGSKKVKVTWTKSKADRSGVQVRYSLKKTMKSAKSSKVKKAAAKTTTLKKLKKGKKYYVQVRAYKTVGGKTYYGAWSAKASVKVK